MLVIRRVMRRDSEGKSRVFAAMPARRKRLPLHHSHLVLVLMDAIMYDVVNSRFGAEVARFELFHKSLKLSRAPIAQNFPMLDGAPALHPLLSFVAASQAATAAIQRSKVPRSNR